jgi:membrane associated rhomboid family serine protease
MKWVEDFDSGEGQGPMWIRGYPLYGTTVLIIIHCISLVAFSLFSAFRYLGPYDFLTFSSSEVLRGQIWRLFTYAFVQMPTIWFPVEMLMFYWFGKDVEKFVGRRAYFSLYLALILAPSLFLTVLGHFGHPQILAGSNTIHFSIFVAFATIYPNAVLLFRILAKHFVYIYLAIVTLVCLASHQWTQLMLLYLNCTVAFLGMKMAGVQGGLDWWNTWRTQARWKKMERKHQAQAAQETELNESIDPILEKISKQGMSSLSETEKSALERARSALLKKDKEK